MLVEIAASSFPPASAAAAAAAESSSESRSNRPLLSPARPARSFRPRRQRLTWPVRSDARVGPVEAERTTPTPTVKRPRTLPLPTGPARARRSPPRIRPPRRSRSGRCERPRRAPAGEVGNGLAELVRQRGVQRTSGQALVRTAHFAFISVSSVGRSKRAERGRAPGRSFLDQHNVRRRHRPVGVGMLRLCYLPGGYTRNSDSRRRSLIAPRVAPRSAERTWRPRGRPPTPGPSRNIVSDHLGRDVHG